MHKEYLLAILFGDVSAALVAYFNIDPTLNSVYYLEKAFGILIWSILGGIGGMLGKLVFDLAVKLIKKK